MQSLYPNVESKEHSASLFDQICINFINERMQLFFVDLTMKKQKVWYDKEKLDVPFVPFFDNADVVGKSLTRMLHGNEIEILFSPIALHTQMSLSIQQMECSPFWSGKQYLKSRRHKIFYATSQEHPKGLLLE